MPAQMALLPIGIIEVTENSIFVSTNYPLHGAYDSNDENIIRSHMAVIKQAGIDGIIVSWWGSEGIEAFPLDKIFDVASEFDIDVSLYYESIRDLSQQDIIDEFLYIFRTYQDNQAFMKNNEVPVVFVYAIDVYQRNPEFWQGVRDAVKSEYGEHIMIGDTTDSGYLNVFDGFHMYIMLDEKYPEYYEMSIDNLEIGSSGLEEDIIFQKAMNKEDLELTVKPFLTTVSPSFDARSWGSMEPLVERLDGETYRKYWEVSNELEPHSVLITSWNEWHEGTEMEPSKEYGFSYIQMTKEYIEEYKGVTIPIDEVSYSASLGEFTHSSAGTGSGDIQINTQQGHALYVNVTVEWGTDIQAAEIECEPYIYLTKVRDNSHSLIIPSIPSGEGLAVHVKYETDEGHPELGVSITAYDQAGNFYELLDNIVSSSRVIEMIYTNIIIETGNETFSIDDPVQVIGYIDPIVSNVVINIDYTKPDGTQVSKSARTDSTGSFTSTHQLGDLGSWSIHASWLGNEEYTDSESQRITVNVETDRDDEEIKKPFIPGYPVEAIILVLLLFIVFPRTEKSWRKQIQISV